jgi:hypothetical protein
VNFAAGRASDLQDRAPLGRAGEPPACIAARAVVVMEIGMKRYFACGALLLLIGSAFADTPPPTQETQKQPRTLGQKAVLHIYYYAPKTLEITYVDSYLFKDEDACRNAISAALQIAMPYAGEGDLVSAKCVGMNPPEAITKPQQKPESPESTAL